MTTNCFGAPDEYQGFTIKQLADDKFYAYDENGPVSDGYDTWDDLKNAMDGEFDGFL